MKVYNFYISAEGLHARYLRLKLSLHNIQVNEKINANNLSF